MDFGRTADDYVTHRAGFPHQLFQRLAQHGIGKPGQAILDLGTGTGSLARGFARQGATVMGLDISAEMLAAAQRVSREEGLDVAYRQAPAEDTGLPSGYFDVVSAGQCWHWFDRSVATREVQRLLKPEGRLIITHFDWLPLPGNVVEATEELICLFNPSWSMGGGAGIYPAWFADVAAFREIESFTFDLAVEYHHEAWRGRIRASSGVGGSLEPEAVAGFDGELATLLRDRYPQDLLAIPHRSFTLMATRPPI